MASIKCPKCKLVNKENTKSCRRCGTSLAVAKGRTVPKTGSHNRFAGRYVIPVVVIGCLLCVYGFYRHSQNPSRPESGLTRANKTAVENRNTNSPELEGVKKLNRDFLDRLDKNSADRRIDGLSQNQTLALDTMMVLREQQNKLTEPSAIEYLDKFYELVEGYHGQVVRFNSETARLTQANQEITNEIKRVREDTNLSAEDKTSRQAEPITRLPSESQDRSVSAQQINDTVEALRKL